MKIVQKFSHAKQSETTPASGAVNESDHRDDSESAFDVHDRTPVSPVPTFRNRVGGLGHLSLVILFLISSLYAAKRDLSSFTLNALFLMLIGGYDWMQPMLQGNVRVTTGAVLHTEADRDDSCKSSEPSRLSSLTSELHSCDNDSNLLDEPIIRPERLVTPEVYVSGAEDCEDDHRPPLLEIDPDVLTTADSRRESRYEDLNRSMRVLQSRQSDSYSITIKPRDPYQPPLFEMPPPSLRDPKQPNFLGPPPPQSLHDLYQPYLFGMTPPQSLREPTTRAGNCLVDDATPVVPTRMPYRMNLAERIAQEAKEIISALNKDKNNSSEGAFGPKGLPSSTVDNYSFLLGRVVPKAYIPGHSTITAKTREDTVTEINLTTADKPSRKKERRARQQRVKRQMESSRKKEVGAANLKKGEELVDHMFRTGWVPGDMEDFQTTLELLLEAREEIYEELVREGDTDHGWWLYDLMSSWERKPGAMNKEEEERIQRLIKSSWLNIVK